MTTARRDVPRAVHDAFPLRTVAAKTGLSPDLIRAWEKRHAVVTPIRGARGARLYTAAEIAHLRLLARVVAAGRAIGDVAALSPAELERLAAQRAPEAQEYGTVETQASRAGFVNRILQRLAHFEHGAVTRLLGDALVALGVRAFVAEVALPLMRRVGARWADADLTVAEEHLLTGALRNLLAGLPQGQVGSGPPIVLATPAGERHEIGLLLVALLARDAGANVVYLTIDLPAADIAAAATRVRAAVVGLSVVASENRKRAVAEITAIQHAVPSHTELWLGGADARETALRVKDFRGLVVDALETTEAELARIAAGAPPAA